jgi:hypothetical protein
MFAGLTLETWALASLCIVAAAVVRSGSVSSSGRMRYSVPGSAPWLG